jgi:hypothetical protein
MTKVTITKNNGKIVTVECDGHTNYGEKGEDIVCASLSSVVQTALLGLLVVAGVEIDMSRDDERGYLKFSLPQKIGEREMDKCQTILETMLCGVSDLYTGFSDFIELEVKD